MGEALKGAYGDLFTIKAAPTAADRALIEGKFKSTHNATPNTAKLMANTFYALLALGDLNAEEPAPPPVKKPEQKKQQELPAKVDEEPAAKEVARHRPTLHYNIQIHLPATKDVEVFNAIFKSLKEHLLD
jgi:hypothetical protein